MVTQASPLAGRSSIRPVPSRRPASTLSSADWRDRLGSSGTLRCATWWPSRAWVLRVLRDLQCRIWPKDRGPGDVDVDEVINGLNDKERRWVDSLVAAVQPCMESPASARDGVLLLHRLRVQALGEMDDLKEHAIARLAKVFGDPDTVWAKLVADVAANPFSYARFTASRLRSGPLRGARPHSVAGFAGRFDLVEYAERLRSFLQPPTRIETGLTISDEPIGRG